MDFYNKSWVPNLVWDRECSLQCTAYAGIVNPLITLAYAVLETAQLHIKRKGFFYTRARYLQTEFIYVFLKLNGKFIQN